MGSLKDFDLPKLKERFRLKCLVETGTGEGNSLRHALEVADWDEVYSIEVDLLMHDLAMAKGYASVLWHGITADTLPAALKRIADKGPTLFWLDAHFPHELSGKDLIDEPDMTIRLPLESELRVILENRNAHELTHDLFIIDDAWIYQDGIAECGDFDRRMEVTGGANDDFIWDLLKSTHLVYQDPRANGYTIAVPKLAARYVLDDCMGETDSAKLREF